MVCNHTPEIALGVGEVCPQNAEKAGNANSAFRFEFELKTSCSIPCYQSLQLKTPPDDLIVDCHLLGSEGGDVAVVVCGFHNDCVASVGERDCVQCVLKTHV